MDNITKVSVYEEPFPLAVIKGGLSKIDMQMYLRELHLLNDNMLYGRDSNREVLEDGTPIKRNKGIFLDTVYTEPHFSDILEISNRRLGEYLSLVHEEAKDSNWFFKYLNTCSVKTTLAYYEEGDYYKAHKDLALLTAITWVYEEPKRFKGGNVTFPDHDLTVEVDNNTTVIFPGCIPHQVSEVSMLDSKDKGKGLGRYAMIQFGNADNA